MRRSVQTKINVVEHFVIHEGNDVIGAFLDENKANEFAASFEKNLKPKLGREWTEVSCWIGSDKVD